MARGKLRKRAWRALKGRWRKRRTQVSRERAKQRKQAAKGGAQAATRTPSAIERARVAAHHVLAQRSRAADTDELAAQRHRNALRRLDRHHAFTCGGHTPPQRFASADDLNRHFAEEHDGPVRHTRGSVAPTAPGRRTLPPPSPAVQARRPSPRPRGRSGSPRERDLERALRRVEHHMTKIRKDAVSNVGATDATNSLGDIGSTPIRSVSQIRDIATAFEAVALAAQEAVDGFQHNARTSEEAPIKDEVLNTLNQAREGAEQMATAAVAFLAAFEDEYGDDIRAAAAGERMDNAALTS